MKEYETSERYGNDSFIPIYALDTLIYDVPLDDIHWTNNTHKTRFIIIAANQFGLKNLYKLVSLVNTRDESILDPLVASNFTKGLIFAKEIVNKDTGNTSWEARFEAINSGDPIAVLQNFSDDELKKIEHLIDAVKPIPQTRGSQGEHWPSINNSHNDLREVCMAKARSIYGDELPKTVENRLAKELNAIIGNGFEIIYQIARMLIQKAKGDNVEVSYKGGAGASLAGFMADITDINPLPPHYICPECFHFEVPNTDVDNMWDLPEAKCPVCGSLMKKDGYNIPYEAFLGLMLDREPDIDVAVDEDYHDTAVEYLSELFGEKNIYRAKMDDDGSNPYEKMDGIFILPEDKDILDFTPVEIPYDSGISSIPITHFHYTELDQHLFKQDIISSKVLHLLAMLHIRTDVDPRSIPLDDKRTLSLFSSANEFGENGGLIGTGTYGIPFVEDDEIVRILKIVKPQSLEELIRTIGLAAGIGTWEDNAEVLLEECGVAITDLISSREDVLNYLTAKGVSMPNAYKIMLAARISRNLSDVQIKMLKDYCIPEWYASSCNKISFLWNRAGAVMRAITAYRIAWYKLYYPSVFYSVWLACFAPEYHEEFFVKDEEELRKTIEPISDKDSEKNELMRIEEDILRIYRILYELRIRGFKFEGDICHLGEEIPEEDVPAPIDQERYKLIAKWIKELASYYSKEDIAVLNYRFENGEVEAHSVEDAADKFGINPYHVRYLEAKAARLIKQPGFIEVHTEPPLQWDYSAEEKMETITDEEYEELTSSEYDLLPGYTNYNEKGYDPNDPINADDTLDLTDLLKLYEEENLTGNN